MNEQEKQKLKQELEKTRVEPEELVELSSAVAQKLSKRRKEIREILAEVEGALGGA